MPGRTPEKLRENDVKWSKTNVKLGEHFSLLVEHKLFEIPGQGNHSPL